MANPQPAIPSTPFTPARLVRLYRLLRYLDEAPRTRAAVLKRMKLDERGFYRDLKLLRELNIPVSFSAGKYRLTTPLTNALTLLPFPDPGLTFEEALTLSRGKTRAHQKLKKQMEVFEGKK